MEFTEVFKKLLNRSEISQSTLSKELGFTPQAINKWYLGKTEPDTKTIKKIANYFNVSTDYLIGNDNTSNNDEEEKEKDYLQELLTKNGYMKQGEDLSNDELERLIEFVVNNKDILKGNK